MNVSLAVETHSLSKTFGSSTAVDDLNLQVPQGAAFGFLGANGAGKTTTVDILTTLSHATRGWAKVMGYDVMKASVRVRERIGVVSDADRPPLPHWNAVDYVSFFAELHDVRRGTARRRAEEALIDMGLGAHLRRPIGKFSSGMRRKVELVRALAHHPRVVFLDEPTRQLDIVARRDFWSMLRELNTSGTTIFLTSHDPAEVAAVCSHIGVLDHGRLLFQGTLKEFAGSSPTAESVHAAMDHHVRHRAEGAMTPKT